MDTTTTQETENKQTEGNDELKNLKAEFNRKISNVESTLKQSNEALLAQLQNMLAKPKAQDTAPPAEDIESLMWSKPGEAVKRIKAEAKSEILKEVEAREQDTVRRNTVINNLYAEFPELAVNDSPMTQLAISKFNEMSKELGNSPATYKAAVAEAALELGLKPKSKRPASSDDEDNFSLSGSSQMRSRPASKRNGELHPNTEMAAKLLGVDPEKVKARMKARKSYGNWE